MNEIFNKLLKYILMSLITFLSVSFVPSNDIKTTDGLKITFIITIFYALLDRVLPSIYYTYKNSNNDENKS